ncbi:lysozyme inhibitor LprI family protein [uncultured Paracoccus sp.]|uniref:lysozyme inhibitor LprI family protein n=1 Tax=uncultured Paracoccus sp. TaxID=189685 RepID=UPI00261FBBF0|nr:lysozyme inhibitor LprI family protein [uncultured Paracoccus sp.]
MIRQGFLIALLATTPSLAQEVSVDSATVEACFDSTAGGETQPDCIGAAQTACIAATPGGANTLNIWQCTQAETQVWDRLLNREYKATRAHFADIEGIGDQLLAAQRGWIALRDADCTIAYDRYGGGSMRNIAATHCKLTYTARRALELKHMREP